MIRGKIPTILGIFFLTIGLAIGVVLINNKQIFRLRASPEITPKDVRISNITESSFTVSWTTDKETQGFIRWGENDTSLNKTQVGASLATSFTHSLTITGLTASNTYYFKINSEGTDFDNNGIVWQTKTGVEILIQPEANVISGSVNTKTQAPVNGALVYITIGGSGLLSTTSTEDGGWSIPISTARTKNLTSYIPFNESTTIVEITVQAGPMGVASAQIYPVSAKPVPPIVLGQTHNFRGLRPEKNGELPEASLSLPEEATPASRFTLPEVTPTPTAPVTLESLEEGEILRDSKPEFTGTGLASIILTIEIKSNPQTHQVRVDSAGNWSFTPSIALSGGEHKITISWRGPDGIPRTLTRNFTVLAAGPTATPTPTPTATLSPTPTATPTLTPTPKTATESALPASGVLTPSIFLFIISLASLTLGGSMLVLSTVKDDNLVNHINAR